MWVLNQNGLCWLFLTILCLSFLWSEKFVTSVCFLLSASFDIQQNWFFLHVVVCKRQLHVKRSFNVACAFENPLNEDFIWRKKKQIYGTAINKQPQMLAVVVLIAVFVNYVTTKMWMLSWIQEFQDRSLISLVSVGYGFERFGSLCFENCKQKNTNVRS